MARVYTPPQAVKPASNKKGRTPKEAKGGSAQAAEGEKEQAEQKEQKEGEGE